MRFVTERYVTEQKMVFSAGEVHSCYRGRWPCCLTCGCNALYRRLHLVHIKAGRAALSRLDCRLGDKRTVDRCRVDIWRLRPLLAVHAAFERYPSSQRALPEPGGHLGVGMDRLRRNFVVADGSRNRNFSAGCLDSGARRALARQTATSKFAVGRPFVVNSIGGGVYPSNSVAH